MRAFCMFSTRAVASIRSHFGTLSFLAILWAFLALSSVCSAAQVTLVWDSNPEPTISGYRVYFGTSSNYYVNVIDVGNRTSCTITGLLPGITYYISATAYATTGDESSFSGEIIYTVPGSVPSSSGSSGGGGCFIATVAYGSHLAPEVVTLREFRDHVLLTTGLGQMFVEGYYRVSPPIAAFI
ncbi:MAG: fibronectin type III domain-containing protein [Syntrophorhabdus sp.]